MQNPILAKLNAQPQRNNTNIFSLIAKAKMDPVGTFNNLRQTNPDFNRFINQNMNKTPSQIANDMGISESEINKYR